MRVASVVVVAEPTPEPERVKASLRRLAGPSEATVIGRASEATGSIDAASRFVESVGLDRLETAIAVTDDPDLERRGRDALGAFRRFRRAAAGEPHPDGDHFHRGHGTDLRRDGERFSQ